MSTRSSRPSALYPLSLHDALPICTSSGSVAIQVFANSGADRAGSFTIAGRAITIQQTAKRSEEHTSELQSHSELVCRLLLEKKKDGHVILFAEDVNFRRLWTGTTR